jgi:putative transposase
MAATLDDVAKMLPAELSAEQELAAELVCQPREKGLPLTCPDGLSRKRTKSVIEATLGENVTNHLGHAKNNAAGPGGANIRHELGPRRC